jgi:hydrogenase-4 component E
MSMDEGLYVQLLDLACGALLLCAVLVLWRRELAVIIRVFAAQGVGLAAMVGVLAVHQRSAELAAVAVGLLVLRAAVLPWLLARALAGAGEARRETRPVVAEQRVNVAASLLAAAVLAMVAYAVSRPLVSLAPSPATQAIPVGVTVVLIGFFVLVTRRRALSQLMGFLLMDNGITAVGFLTASTVGLAVELGVSLDVLLAVLVLQILAARMRETFGDTDLDELRELHD